MSRFYFGTFGVGMSVSRQDEAQYAADSALANNHQYHAYWKMYEDEIAKGEEANPRKVVRYHRLATKYAKKLPRPIDWS